MILQLIEKNKNVLYKYVKFIFYTFLFVYIFFFFSSYWVENLEDNIYSAIRNWFGTLALFSYLISISYSLGS